jgi:uncharacterized protein YfaT (DUF1175 family)
LSRLDHPADRAAFRRRFCEAAEGQFLFATDRTVIDCSSLVRFAYAAAKPPSPLFETPEGRRYFADAQTLKERNSVFVSRDWRASEAGDLWFFLQLIQDQPFHVMVHLGESAIQPDGQRYVVYHTGGRPGEVRRPTILELLTHPDPRWRPLAANPAFLGVYRWRILS